jgi:hypothetical protein
MKNLEKFGVKQLRTDEQINIQGGWCLSELAGYAVGAVLGIALETVKLIAQNIGSFKK